MARPKHAVWSHFFSITKAEENSNDDVKAMKNTKHKAGWCYACLDLWINTDLIGSEKDLGDAACFLGPETTQRTYRRAALAHVPAIRGVPGDLVKHLLDCPNVSDKVKEGLNVPSRDTHGQIQDRPPQQTTLKLIPATREFTTAQQQDFKRDILRLIVGLNIAFTKADHPQMEEFCAKWIGLTPPSRRALTGYLLQEEKAAVEAKNTDILVGQRGGTLVCDGWNNSKRQHLVFFMLLTRQHAVPLYYFDNSGVSRTGQLAYEQILQVLESLKVKKIDVYGVCTDDGADQVCDFQYLRQRIYTSKHSGGQKITCSGGKRGKNDLTNAPVTQRVAVVVSNFGILSSTTPAPLNPRKGPFHHQKTSPRSQFRRPHVPGFWLELFFLFFC